MDYSSWVDTSLDLNINPLRVKSEVPVDAERFGMARELKPAFMDFQTKPSAKEEVSNLFMSVPMVFCCVPPPFFNGFWPSIEG